MIRRAHDALRASDPVLLILRASLLVSVVNSHHDPVVLVVMAIVGAVALPRPSLLRSPWLWAGLFVFLGSQQLASWQHVDNHVFLTSYWCAALALGLGAADARGTIAASARLLVGVMFAGAVAWKVGSGEYLDGRFFRHSMLFDERFGRIAEAAGGTTDVMRRSNLDGLNELAADPADGGWLVLREGPRNLAVANLFTWWGVLVETAVAVAFLTPWRGRARTLRPVTLVAFCATTYALVPVGGFGSLLLVLGAAETGSARLRVAFMWGAAGLLVWAAIWPTLFL